tara:strand:+ start:393 stop:1205 length:813 start_codon:yes stop_codon:yes gene_type:complete
MFSDYIQKIKEDGIVKIDNFLTEKELESAKKIIRYYSAPKGHENSYFPVKIKSIFSKLLELNFKKIKNSFFILNLANKKKLNLISNYFFNQKSSLEFVDGYYSKISNKEVLPWHTDQAYRGAEKLSEGFVNPNHFFLKIFIYLTNVGPNNGCTSYIPKSQKIGYAIRKGIYEGKLKYQPYWKLKDFRKLILNKENKDYFINYFNGSSLIDNFLEQTALVEKEENFESSEFDFNLSAGSAIIFDEGGVHKGSKTLLNDRMVMRYMYSIKEY